MNRYIKADDVASAIYHHFPSIRTMADARGVIEEAPSIDIPQWIPCSERLPSDSGEYLVTAGTHDAFVDVLYYGKPLMPNRKVKGKCFYKADDEWGDIVDDDVIAWMPLPKPWKGADDE